MNMAQEVNYLVFDILGDLCFGKQFNMKEPDSDIKHVPELMATFLELLAPVCSISASRAYIAHTDDYTLDRLLPLRRLLALAQASRSGLAPHLHHPGEDEAMASFRRHEP